MSKDRKWPCYDMTFCYCLQFDIVFLSCTLALNRYNLLSITNCVSVAFVTQVQSLYR